MLGSVVDIIDFTIIDFDRINFDRIEFDRIDLCLDIIMQNWLLPIHLVWIFLNKIDFECIITKIGIDKNI
jgi:hypothetical protein